MTASLRLLWIGAFTFFLSFFLLLAALPLYARGVGIGDRAIGGVLGAFAFAANQEINLGRLRVLVRCEAGIVAAGDDVDGRPKVANQPRNL